jgi:hypothetical protein
MINDYILTTAAPLLSSKAIFVISTSPKDSPRSLKSSNRQKTGGQEFSDLLSIDLFLG